jgi:hypothetical protein
MSHIGMHEPKARVDRGSRTFTLLTSSAKCARRSWAFFDISRRTSQVTFSGIGPGALNIDFSVVRR